MKKIIKESKINKDEYIKKLELKIDLMRHFVPTDKEKIIDKKVGIYKDNNVIPDLTTWHEKE